jgi:hypothetical protein
MLMPVVKMAAIYVLVSAAFSRCLRWCIRETKRAKWYGYLLPSASCIADPSYSMNGTAYIDTEQIEIWEELAALLGFSIEGHRRRATGWLFLVLLLLMSGLCRRFWALASARDTGTDCTIIGIGTR